MSESAADPHRSAGCRAKADSDPALHRKPPILSGRAAPIGDSDDPWGGAGRAGPDRLTCSLPSLQRAVSGPSRRSRACPVRLPGHPRACARRCRRGPHTSRTAPHAHARRAARARSSRRTRTLVAPHAHAHRAARADMRRRALRSGCRRGRRAVPLPALCPIRGGLSPCPRPPAVACLLFALHRSEGLGPRRRHRPALLPRPRCDPAFSIVVL